MIISFDNFINEKYGFADSLLPIERYLVKFIEEKFDWWLNRKGMANYADEFVIHFDDIDPNIPKNEDFPLASLVLKLKINIGNNNGVGGMAFSFRKKRYAKHADHAFLYRGKIYQEMEIFIRVNKNVIETQFLKEETQRTIRHELQHIYYGYKLLKKNYDPKEVWGKAIFTNILNDISLKYGKKSSTLDDILDVHYYLFSYNEFLSKMSEFSADKPGIKKQDISTTSKDVENITKIDFETLYNKIVGELKNNNIKVDLDTIPKEFVEECEKNYKSFRMRIPDYLSKYDTDFKNFLKIIYDNIKRREKKFFKKSNKIFYSTVR